MGTGFTGLNSDSFMHALSDGQVLHIVADSICAKTGVRAFDSISSPHHSRGFHRLDDNTFKFSLACKALGMPEDLVMYVVSNQTFIRFFFSLLTS